MHDSYIHACKDVQDNVKEFVINLFINQNVGSADLQKKDNVKENKLKRES